VGSICDTVPNGGSFRRDIGFRARDWASESLEGDEAAFGIEVGGLFGRQRSAVLEFRFPSESRGWCVEWMQELSTAK